jgi:hypothetical protein
VFILIFGCCALFLEIAKFCFSNSKVDLYGIFYFFVYQKHPSGPLFPTKTFFNDRFKLSEMFKFKAHSAFPRICRNKIVVKLINKLFLMSPVSSCQCTNSSFMYSSIPLNLKGICSILQRSKYLQRYTSTTK